MDIDRLKQLLKSLYSRELDVDTALEALRDLPYQQIDQVLFDHHRIIRKGIPEVIYGPGKDRGQLLSLTKELVEKGVPILITRLDQEIADYLCKRVEGLYYNPVARTLSWPGASKSRSKDNPDSSASSSISNGVLVITAGTSDLPVAQEAIECLELLEIPTYLVTDVGIAGIHRLFDKLTLIRQAMVIIVLAGMEGALPGIVAGLSSAPVIAIPTSVGYGSNLGGLVPLLTMLNSCAPGIGVVNIDNGVGAAFLAASIIRTASRKPTPTS